MPRRRLPLNTGLGQFRGNALPQDIGTARLHLLDSTMPGPEGLRLTQNRAFRAANMTPQSFVKQAGGTNSETSLEVATRKRNGRQAMGKFRGLPSMTLGGQE